MFRTKVVQKIKKKKIMFSNFFSENRDGYAIMWKNTVESDRQQTTIWRMDIVWWIPKATNTHSEYVTHCFPTATMVARMHHNVTSWYSTLPVMLISSNVQPNLTPRHTTTPHVHVPNVI
jgi:hypothetical protein